MARVRMAGFHEKGDAAPFVAGSVYGMRSWNYWPGLHGEPWLRGQFKSVWLPRQQRMNRPYEADCNVHPPLKFFWPTRKGVPDEKCGCGFWAYWDMAPAGDVLGVIEGFGRTIIGEKGFRSAKARITALCPVNQVPGTTSLTETALRLQKTWRVPVYLSVAEMRKNHPPTRAPSASWSYPGRTIRQSAVSFPSGMSFVSYADALRLSQMRMTRTPDALQLLRQLQEENERIIRSTEEKGAS